MLGAALDATIRVCVANQSESNGGGRAPRRGDRLPAEDEAGPLAACPLSSRAPQLLTASGTERPRTDCKLQIMPFLWRSSDRVGIEFFIVRRFGVSAFFSALFHRR